MKNLQQRIADLSPEKQALLTRRLQAQRPAVTGSSIPHRKAPGPAPLSFAQQRLWFLDQLEPGTALYNIPAAVRLEGNLDREALARSLEEIVQRHAILRTRFSSTDGSPFQEALPPASFALPLADLQELPPEEREREARRLMREEAARPFELTACSLIRGRLLRLSVQQHILQLTMHHIVSDGWSMGVLVRELAALYAAFAAGRPSPLPELPLQYGDYAAWQRQRLSGEAREGQLAYWKRRLEGCPEFLDLPTDHPRPATRSHRGSSLAFSLPGALAAGLRVCCQREEATLHMVLLAAFQVLLHRYSGQADFAVGIPVAGRTRPELEVLIGFFVNTLALRADLSGEPSFRTLLQRVREACLDAHAQQDVPFDLVIEALRPERDPSHSPLIQVMFALQGTPAPVRLPGLSASPIRVDPGISKFDLTLVVQEEDGGALAGYFEYSTDLFDPPFIERMIGHYRRLLEQAVADPTRPIAALELLSPAERRQLLEEWAGPAGSCAEGLCAQRLFEAQAARSPEAPALLYLDQTLSYRQLDERANRLAARLRRAGVEAETPVAILAPHGPALVIAILATLKAGGAFLPLDPAYPPERLSFMLTDSRSPLLLAPAGLLPLPFDPAPARLLPLEIEEPEPAGPPPPEAPADDPHRLAYLIYTSGSTGRPKGVLIEHRGLVNFATAWIRQADLGPGRRLLQFASPGFDAAVAEIFTALLAGACLVAAPAESLHSLPDLTRLIGERQVDTATLPPSLLALLEPAELPGLRTLVSAGEACPPELAARWAAGRRFLNWYGPTETSIGVCCHPVEARPGPLPSGSRLPIGRPIPGVRLYVLDSHLQPQPVGVPGELCIGGAGVGRGYLDRPALSAEKFLPDPFAPGPPARLYRSGDRARWRPDGSLEFLGRLDRQVKLRGFRIEPGEIEAALAACPAVRQAAVRLLEGQAGGPRLVAYLAPADPACPPSPAALREALAACLPAYMLPASFLFLPALPTTPAGKIDRTALPAPPERGETEGSLQPPRSPVEQGIAEIWRQVLGVGRVGLADNFFELGGHSLLATQAASRIREAFQVELPLRDLFSAPTLAGLAGRVSALIQESGGSVSPPIRRTDRETAPLSFAQQRLWFLDQLAPGGALYHLPLVVRLQGPLDVEVLQRSLDELVRRHAVLRTRFPLKGGGPVQEILPPLSLPIRRVDLSLLPAEERESQARRQAEEEARAPFDLAAGPLLRAALFRLDPEDHVAVLVMHHIVSDGWSMNIMLHDLAALYTAFSRGEAPPLADLPIQYADYAAWQRQWLSGEVLERQLAYWKEQLAGLPPLLELPTDRPRPARLAFHGRTVAFEIPAATYDGLRRLSREEGVTLFMALLAAFQVLLGRYSGLEDVPVGTAIAGRTRAEVEGLIGFFVNTLVLRADLSGSPTFQEVLLRVREVTLNAYTYQDLPFETLVEALQPVRGLSHTPLFQVMFVLDPPVPEGGRLPGLSLAPVMVQTGTAAFDLTLSMSARADGLGGTVEYSTDLWDADTIRRLIGHFQAILRRVAEDPEQPVWTLDYLTAEEREQLVVSWNDTTAPAPLDRCAHELFQDRARLRPEAPAIRFFPGQALSYGELNERANRLAHALRRRSAGAGTLAAVCMESSIDTVVAILGALKAGAAFLPLDPAYPPERLSFMLEDSRAPILLTQEALLPRLPEFRGQRLCLDTAWSGIAGEPADDAPRASAAESPAYVIYTSGSTGQPKGAVLRHRGLSNLAEAQRRAFDVREGSRVLQFAPLSFDAAVWEIFMALASGGELVLASRPTLSSPVELLRLLGEARITHATLPPSLLQLLPPADLPDLRVLVAAGEACPAELPARWAPGRAFYNAYGPTEATVCACMHLCDGHEPGPPPIGRPLPNVRLFVADRNGQLVPAGIPGELLIGGAGLAGGYLNRPELTAAAFILDPYSGEPGARLYRSGDRVRRRPDGSLEFLGRLDRQVKLRGFRIEPGEIEAALLAHPAIRQAAVLVREDTPGELRLVAYVVAHRPPAPSSGELRAFLRQGLPEYMLPAVFVALEELPLGPSNKIERDRLPAPDGLRPEQEQEYVAPRDEVEARLAAICASLLGLDRVGIHDNFFELGGHSLLATQAISRIREEFRVELPLLALFEHPRVAALAQAIRERGERPAADSLPPIVPVSREGHRSRRADLVPQDRRAPA